MRFGLKNSGLSIRKVSNYASAANTVITPTAVQLGTYEWLAFIITLGLVDAGSLASFKLQQSVNGTDWNDLEGSKVLIADADDNKIAVLEIIRPQVVDLGKYLRPYLDRGGQSGKTMVIESVVGIWGIGRSAPVLDDDTIIAAGYKQVVAPDYGTA